MALTSKMDKIIPLRDAVYQHTLEYDSGDTDYSVTALQDPPRVVQLFKRYGHQVPFDVQSNLASFMGTAIHKYFEEMLLKSNPNLYSTEIRYDTVLHKRKISGAFDVVMDWVEMFDVKNTKAYNYVYNNREHWTAQQNIYRWLIHKHKGVTLKKLNIIFWAWQFDKFRMMQNRDYPRNQVIQISLPVWSLDRTFDYMNDRVKLMVKSETMSDTQLPHCTEEEMWAKPSQYAVHHTDKKKALRLLGSDKEATDWLNTYQQESGCPLAKLYIDYRPGQRIRCEDWCGINNWCDQYTDYCSMKKGK